MASIASIVAMTELDAINIMLAAVGEAPITDVDTATQGDVVVAIDTLRAVVGEVQSKGWKYNTDLQYRIAVGTSGNDVDKFLVPAGLIAFEVDQRSDQVGAVPHKQKDGTFASDNLVHLDLTIKLDSAGGVDKFYDRITNRFNFGDASDKAQIFITAVWFRDFTDQPQTARNYQAHRAARKFAEIIARGEKISRDLIDDELSALKLFKDEQGMQKAESFLQNTLFARSLGGRARYGIAVR